MARYNRYSQARVNSLVRARVSGSEIQNAHVVKVHLASSNALHAYYTKATQSGRGHDLDYMGGETNAGLKELKHGRNDLAKLANKHLSQFTENIEIAHREWQHAPAGFFPDVPAYLSGEPENMWVIQNEPSDRTPLRIFIGVTSSGGIGAEQLIERGAALIAFALALSEKRPVYLTPYVNLGNGTSGSSNESAIVSWDLNTSPLVLSEVGACLASPNVIRALGLSVCYAANPQVNGSWCAGYENEEYMREQLNAAPDDIYLGSIHINDPLLSNPIKWIKDNLSHYLDDDAD